MSETKHTPLPWRYSEYRPRGGHLRLSIGNKDGSGQVLIARDVGWKRDNLKFIVQTVNARPKVERLVSLLLAWLGNQPDGRGEVELKILEKAREVEAALESSAQ